MRELSGKSAEEWQETLWDKLVEELLKLRTKKDFKNVIENLLSKYEMQFMLRRLATVALIKRRMSYKEIGEVLWISPSTISAIKKNILHRGNNYKSSHALKKDKSADSTANQGTNSSNKIIDNIEKAVGDFLGVLLALGGNPGNREDYFARRVLKGK